MGDGIKTDELSKKFQMAFDPLPPPPPWTFSENSSVLVPSLVPYDDININTRKIFCQTNLFKKAGRDCSLLTWAFSWAGPTGGGEGNFQSTLKSSPALSSVSPVVWNSPPHQVPSPAPLSSPPSPARAILPAGQAAKKGKLRHESSTTIRVALSFKVC